MSGPSSELNQRNQKVEEKFKAEEIQVALLAVGENQYLYEMDLLKSYSDRFNNDVRVSSPLVSVKMSGISNELFEHIDYFLRNGDFLPLTAENILDVYSAAAVLQIKPILQNCEQVLFKEYVDADLYLVYYLECKRMNKESGVQKFYDVLSDQLPKLLTGSALQTLSYETFSAMFTDSRCKKLDTTARIVLAIKWLQGNCTKRFNHSKNILSEFTQAQLDAVEPPKWEICPRIRKEVVKPNSNPGMNYRPSPIKRPSPDFGKKSRGPTQKAPIDYSKLTEKDIDDLSDSDSPPVHNPKGKAIRPLSPPPMDLPDWMKNYKKNAKKNNASESPLI